MQLADEALSDASYLLQDNRLKAAANRAYYAMFHAVRAALAGVEARRPKSHAGAINLFGRHYIRTGRLDRLFAKDLQDAYDLRQQSDYDVHADIVQDEAKDVVAKAGLFVAEVKKVIDYPAE